MRAKILALLTVAVLLAAAFFLPEMLLVWGDEKLLDTLHMESRDEEREGFAESIQLTVPEKIMLLRSGTLTVMELNRTLLESASADAANTVLLYSSGEDQAAAAAEPAQQAGTEAERERYTEETRQLWEARLTSARGEIRSLQALGGLPELWKADSLPDYTGYGDLLYLDPATRMSFQVYQMTLLWDSCELDLLVDAESERILSFTLRWTQGNTPNWGLRKAANFGSAWRDYWRMDSVSTGWYNEYIRGILEEVEPQLWSNGDYASHGQITYMYDGQSLPVPLDCQGLRVGNFLISWNR